jgi:hypothetical protein
VITAFVNSDLETLGYLRGKLGNVPILLARASGASSSALLGGARPMQDDLREAALLDTTSSHVHSSDGLMGPLGVELVDEEIEADLLLRGKRRMLVLAAGQQPLILERLLYFDDAMFKGMFDQ